MCARGVIMRTHSCSGAGRRRWTLCSFGNHGVVGIYRAAASKMGYNFMMPTYFELELSNRT